MIATVVWVFTDYGWDPVVFKVGLALLMVLMALAMVSNVKYRSFKDVDFRDKMPFIGLIVLVLIIAMIYLDPPLAFLAMGSIYMISGAVTYGIRRIKLRKAK